MSMIKGKVKQILRTEEIDDLKIGINELSRKIDCLSEKLDGYVNLLNDRFDQLRANQREHISLDSVVKLDDDSRILICGFYGARNLGDELMLETILRELDERGVRATVMLSNNYELDASYYAPHRVIYYPRKGMDIAVLAEKFDTIIWGGGAVIDDSDYCFKVDHAGLAYTLLALSKAVLKRGGNVAVLGVSTNKELNDARFVSDLNEVVGEAKYFALRDSYSLETLRNCGVEVDKIKMIDDLALGSFGFDKIKKKQGDDVTIGIVYVMDDEKMALLCKYTSTLVRTLQEKYGKRKNINIRLIPFYDYMDNDRKLFDVIENKCLRDLPNNIKVIKEEYVNNMKGVQEILAACDYIISMRYHATLIAGYLGANVLSIDLRKVHKHYYNKLKYIKDKYCLELLSFDYGERESEFKKSLDKLLNLPRRTVDEKELRRIVKAVRRELGRALDLVVEV